MIKNESGEVIRTAKGVLIARVSSIISRGLSDTEGTDVALHAQIQLPKDTWRTADVHSTGSGELKIATTIAQALTFKLLPNNGCARVNVGNSASTPLNEESTKLIRCLIRQCQEHKK